MGLPRQGNELKNRFSNKKVTLHPPMIIDNLINDRHATNPENYPSTTHLPNQIKDTQS